LSGQQEKHAALCRLEDLSATGAKGVSLMTAEGRREIVVVAHQGGALAYENRCPHQGTPLEISPDRFVDSERRMLICSTHGARFRITDGYCFSGPCQGEALAAVAIAVTDGVVRLAE
jgi:nitrite reductase/ring-hydroxylating ferredoxin subunit